MLLKQEKQNKLSTPFAPEPYDVVSRNGSSFTIKSTAVVQLKRNTAHVKKYVQEDVQAESPTLKRLSAMYLETDGGKEKNAVSKRPPLTDLETNCGKFRTATDDDHLQDQFIIRSCQRSSKALAKDESLSNIYYLLCLLLLRCWEPNVMSTLDRCFWGCGYAWH